MQRESPPQPDLSLNLFKPSGRSVLILSPLVVAAVGLALYLRYDIIQNTPIGLACEAGEQSLTCLVRLAAIHLFVRSIFGWTAVVAALLQLWRLSTDRKATGASSTPRSPASSRDRVL